MLFMVNNRKYFPFNKPGKEFTMQKRTAGIKPLFPPVFTHAHVNRLKLYPCVELL